ncbi:unnamed protein product [Orchesella dallaii]|uniref:Ionotropic glutamate receptor C-terminal domain-containing protein n=1 Tax=Orchesella dallaii TaxID=48710 RepID=A0ABP1QA32_9HEXA
MAATSDLSSYATFSQAQSTLIQHFKDSTVQFVWEEETNVTKSFFDICIIYHCISIHFHLLQLEHKFFQNSTHSKRRAKPIQQQAYEHILEENARVISQQRYSSSRHLLLIWDATFPKRQSRALQTIIGLEQHKPFTIPIAMLLATTLQLMESKDAAISDAQVNSIFTKILLIFISLDDNSVKIGCFACKTRVYNFQHTQNQKVQMYITGFQTATRESMKSFNNLILFRNRLHSHLHFDTVHSSSCNVKNPRDCKMHETYCHHKNYTDYRICKAYYSHVVRFSLETRFENPHFGQQIFSYGQNQIDFTFQIIIPKVRVLEGNLAAFLIPFEATVWVFTLLTMVSISIWLVWVEKQRVDVVLIWQFSILLEQDGGELKQSRFQAKVITMMWIFCTILLRQFYNSSLYSFITAEPKPTDLPQSVHEVLNRMDFDLLIPSSFIREMLQVFLKDEDSTLPLQLTKLYLNIIHKSYFINGLLHIPTLRNASSGKYTEIWHFPQGPHRNNSR